jgi:hypothetical protein
MFLTADELVELTGLKRPGAQVRWLAAAGIRCLVAADGRPRVLRAEVERLLSSGPPARRDPELRIGAL